MADTSLYRIKWGGKDDKPTKPYNRVGLTVVIARKPRFWFQRAVIERATISEWSDCTSEFINRPTEWSMYEDPQG
jgi:hypothetical protein